MTEYTAKSKTTKKVAIFQYLLTPKLELKGHSKWSRKVLTNLRTSYLQDIVKNIILVIHIK